ncbi:hypothetical protein [Companilactobacillus kimchii]|uniref:Uncharacterized protein n=1 Tax=Companilactobacillus kimchii DSM 13961 = JCM 10707 TaxID=1423765 RepID=A0ABR5NST6_9LACO|nr:hypothetical protein [Companilactobacillus kimchii]KAE9562110.1 hypothetical protein ATN91_05845 [Companilactobacillus kimchii]KRK51273.1 hypothetical protein FC97_GL000965 [Companilactobacillus kimchii DSM 13961 = JCM 10707]GEO46158.1 hypothetical protein LKI01_01570 [Companilactobacillus paralimentarius]
MNQTDKTHLILVDTSKNKNSLQESINLLDRFGINHIDIQPNQNKDLTGESLYKIADNVIRHISNRDY